jgi:hypothetical protein
MKEIIKFLKQRQNVKYSVWIIIFGLIFAFIFQTNRVQISQILEKSLKIIPGTKEARQYQVSGWQGARVKGKRSILRVSLPEKKTYRMVVRAFSCSPPDARDQRIEMHFNDVALDRLKFRKTPKWQEFRINIHPYLIKETNTIKIVYTQDTSLFPIIFDYLEFRNYTFRIKDLYLLFDFLVKRQINYSTFRILSHSLSFAFLLWFFWLLYSRFLSFAVKMKFSRAIKIDFWTYFPSGILFSLFALVSFFSPYHFVYSLKAFFVLALAPVVTLKLFPYTGLFCRFLLRAIEKTCVEVRRVSLFLKGQVVTFRKFFIKQHKTNLSSAFILDFMLLFVLCAILLTIKAEWIAKQLANLAYFLLVLGTIMKAIQFFQESKKK